MDYFINTEFIDLEREIDLISLGIVADDGREFYAISTEFEPAPANAFVRTTVFPLLEPRDHPAWMSRAEMKDALVAFVADDLPRFWGWGGTPWDFIAMAQLFPVAERVPDGWRYTAYDVSLLVENAGLEVNPVDPSLPQIGFAQTKLAWEPWGGVLRQQATDGVFREVAADDHVVQLSADTSVPARPMVGWIGLIQREYEADPWDHGGNLDTSSLTIGSTIYLHDSTGSGRFLLGDLHAAMGDGEVSGMGVEIAGEVRVSVDVIERTAAHRPMISTPTTVSHLASRFREIEAYAQCVADAAAHLAYSQSISTDEANAWLGAVGDLRVSSVVAHTPTYRMDVPRDLLRLPEDLLRSCPRTLLEASGRPCHRAG